MSTGAIGCRVYALCFVFSIHGIQIPRFGAGGRSVGAKRRFLSALAINQI